MCHLRTIVLENALPQIHVVGENRLESTAQLAVRPFCEDDCKRIDETDFVNVQAIVARALVQALAYPYMQPALVQLLSQGSSSPSLYMIPAGRFVPYHTACTFAEVVRQVKPADSNSVCIGYRVAESNDADTAQTKNVICPGLH